MTQPYKSFQETAALNRIVTDMAPVLIWISGPDNQCHFCNKNWLQYTGLTMEQASGNGWLEAIHPDDEQHYRELYDVSVDARKIFKIKFRLKQYNGNYCWLLNNSVPYYADNGSFAGYINTAMDIEELLHVEKEERELISNEALETQQALNEEYASINEELSAANEELTSINEELQEAQRSLTTLNDALEEKVANRTKALMESEAETQLLNGELTAINEELTATNEELITTNEDLQESEARLQKTVEELTFAKLQLERSERLFRSIALNIPSSLIIVIDKDHRFITVEGDLMVKMGFERKNYEGKHPTEVAPQERYDATKHLYERVMAGEKFSMERKSEQGEDFMVHFVPLTNEQGEVYAGLIIALDITDIKEAEKNSARLAAIIESSDDAIISKTLDGIITSWNKSAERTFGYNEEEMIGESILKLIPEDRKEEEPKILSRLRNGERVEHFETKRVTKDNKILDLSLTISPIKDKHGNIIGLSKIARDISERKRDEQRKNDFIGMVSHELKTPLTSLTLILQLLDQKHKGSNEPFTIEALEKAGAQAKRMNNLINGFLNISRLESSQILILKQDFDLVILLKEMIDETKVTTSVHSLNFKGSDTPVTVHADRDKIGSVISNLLSNAIKYSPQGKNIDIDIAIKNQEVIVSVSDYGIGIKPSDLLKIFDRYYRVEGNFTQFISGFGIGLYLSTEIINRHEGKLWAESEFEKGSTFYFNLGLVGA
jgi:PAS domain S-box-containing protein